MIANLPQAVKVCLWSYDTTALDRDVHKQLIIVQVLNYGTFEAVEWLRETYSTDEIKNALAQSMRSEWSKKSLNFWSGFFQTSPSRESRFV